MTKEIANQIRSMKRLWVNKGLGGLLHRRDAEADLVESCIESIPAPVSLSVEPVESTPAEFINTNLNTGVFSVIILLIKKLLGNKEVN